MIRVFYVHRDDEIEDVEVYFHALVDALDAVEWLLLDGIACSVAIEDKGD